MKKYRGRISRDTAPLKFSAHNLADEFVKWWGESVAWGGLCLRFHPKCSKFGTVLHLGPKILGKIKKIGGVKGTVFLTIENVKNGIL